MHLEANFTKSAMRADDAFPNPGTTVKTPAWEITSLTSIRGLAALWVVLFHFSSVLFSKLPELSFLQPLVAAGEFAVPLFFILSGYVLGLRYLRKLVAPSAFTLFRFWWLRIGRIYPVHFATLVLSLGMVARHGWPADAGHTQADFVANCFLIHAWSYHFHLNWNYPSWSLSSEWFAYLIFPLAATAIANVSRQWLSIGVIAACALSSLVYAFEQSLVFKGLCVVIPTFVGGVILAVLCPPSTSQRLWRWANLGLASAIALPFLAPSQPVLGALYLILFFALVAALGAAGHHCSSLWRSRGLVYLGDISYSLYMTHVITITLLTRFFPDGLFQSEKFIARLAAVTLDLAVIVGAAVGMYYVVEKPLRVMSRRVVSRGEPL